MKKITIAIDGFSSCGKSTMAKDLAREIGYIYIDSGAMYRAVTLYCLRHGLFHGDEVDTDRLKTALPHIDIAFKRNPETGKPQTYLDGTLVENDIRTLAVSFNVSILAALGFVREAMVSLQQQMGREKGIVMDGRDIGTVVLPDADVKIFLCADLETRARRRCLELEQRGTPKAFEEVLQEMEQRDYNDTHRAAAPLRPADDAIMINTDMDFHSSLDLLLDVIKGSVGA